MARPTLIAPSLLACDFGRVAEEMARAEAAGADWHHVDVMDGHFVPNLSIGIPVVASMKKAAKLPLDVHLMIEQPAAWAARYAEAGADRLCFHYEAAAGDFGAALDAYHATGLPVGVAVNPPCGVEPLREHFERLDMITVMSVHAGFGGQSFMPEVLDKVRQLRDWGYEGHIQVDGGVDDANAPRCLEAGANVLVAGTYLFRAPDMAAAVGKLRAGAADRAQSS